MSKDFQRQDRRALAIKEAAQACGLSRATLYRLIADRKLATIKIGARRLVPVVAIDALLSGAEKWQELRIQLRSRTKEAQSISNCSKIKSTQIRSIYALYLHGL